MRRSSQLHLLATVALLLLAFIAWERRLASRYTQLIRAQPAAAARWEEQIRQSHQQRQASERQLANSRAAEARLPAAEASPFAMDVAGATEVDRWVRQVKQLKQGFANQPEQRIPEFAVLDDLDWLRAARRVKLDTPDDRERAFAIIRNTARNRFVQFLQRTLEAYLKANHGELPTEVAELRPYYPDPTIDPAVWTQYRMVRAGRLSDASTGPVISLRSLIDDDYDDKVSVDVRSDHSLTYSSSSRQDPATPPSERNLNDEIERDVRLAVRAYVATNGGTLPSNPAQLLPYFNPPLGPLMTEHLSRPVAEEDRRKFLQEVARLAGAAH